jgi:hypothetical protein
MAEVSRSFDELLSTEAPAYLQSDHPFYERKPVTDLWNRLTNVAELQLRWEAVADKQDVKWLGRKSRLLHVSGPPGSGKSSAVYAWAHKTCCSSGYSVAWIDVANKTGDDDGRCWFWKRDDNQAVVTERVAADQVEASIVILDGLRSETVGDWEYFAKRLVATGVVVILVSSEGVRLHAGNMNNIASLEHRFPSWAMKEYQHASRIDAIWRHIADEAFGEGHIDDNAVAREVALEAKYPVAGHSARFMFNKPLWAVEEELLSSSEALDTLKHLRQAMTRRRNKGAVNTLMAWLHENGATPNYTARFMDSFVLAATTKQELRVVNQEYQHITEAVDDNCLVSSFAARKVIENIETDVSTLRSVGRALGVRAVEGYALEASFSKSLQVAVSTAHAVTVYAADGVAQHWSAASFRNTENVFDAIVANRDVGSWIWIGGYQAGFDAVHIYDTRKIRFVQVTAGKKHDYLFSAMHSLLEMLALQDITFTHVDFVVVRPIDDERDFAQGDVTGRLEQGWNDFNGTPWNTRDPSLNTRILKIGWSI